LEDFFGEDNIFIAFGQEKHSAGDFDLTTDGMVLVLCNIYCEPEKSSPFIFVFCVILFLCYLVFCRTV